MSDPPYAGRMTDRGWLVARLAEQGLSPAAAQEKAGLFARAGARLAEPASDGSAAEARAYYVPGRIEVLGKHTDYAGGSSLVAAAERGFCLVAAPRRDDRINVADVVSGEQVGFKFHADLAPRLGHWSNYPMTVARRLARNFPGTGRGADIAFASDLPPAAGMSSSSALMVAIFFALADANDISSDAAFLREVSSPEELAGYLATIENGRSYGALAGDLGVGTLGGSEDHSALCCAQSGHLCEFTYFPVNFERAIAVPAGHEFAIGASGVVAEKTGAAQEKYNRASRLVSTIVELWHRETGRSEPHLAAVLASSPDAAAQLKTILQAARHDEFPSAALLDRLAHFTTEAIEILPAAARALTGGDLAEFGHLVDASQRGAERLLGNQVPETICLARAARERGAAAASAFGAGFGGSVWALVEETQADAFLASWAAAYRHEFPQHFATATFFTTAAGPAAFRL